MQDWYPEEPSDGATFTVALVILAATVLFATHTYWDGYAAGRCYEACHGEGSATLWPDGTCSCGRTGVGTVP